MEAAATLAALRPPAYWHMHLRVIETAQCVFTIFTKSKMDLKHRFLPI